MKHSVCIFVCNFILPISNGHVWCMALHSLFVHSLTRTWILKKGFISVNKYELPLDPGWFTGWPRDDPHRRHEDSSGVKTEGHLSWKNNFCTLYSFSPQCLIFFLTHFGAKLFVSSVRLDMTLKSKEKNKEDNKSQ